jgi:pimeloyl-ACP methyl ester carboxylesterase
MASQENKIYLDNLSINYRTAGIGPVVLIMHGWMHCSRNWVLTADKLAEAGFQAISVDLPGFGKSSEPQGDWNIDDYCQFIKDFSKELGIEPICLVGHSFGGRIVIKLSAQEETLAPKIVLVDSAGMNTGRTLKQKIAIAISTLLSPILNLLGPIKNIAKDFVYKAMHRRDYNEVSPRMRGVYSLAVKEDLKSFASKINLPTLIVWGQNDKSTPLSDAKKLNELIKGSKLEIIKDSGHSPNVHKPEELAHAIINFLKN